MMGMKAMESARHLVDTLQLQDQLTPEDFLSQREKALDTLFPSAQLMPGSHPSSLSLILRSVSSSSEKPDLNSVLPSLLH